MAGRRRDSGPAAVAPLVLRRQVRLTVLVAALATLLAAWGVWTAAKVEARRTAERVSEQIAGSVLQSLRSYDFETLAPAERATVLAELDPYLDSGIVYRVKIWELVGDRFEIVLSDESRLVGESRTLPADLTRRIAGGDPVVVPVPDDAEHRFENAEAGRLLEVFTSFRDAGGHAMLLETYIPVTVAESTETGIAFLVPITLAGLLLLGLALIPTGFALGREVDRRRREQREALDYGLAAAELTRRELARDLHDDVLPRLAGARLLLDAARHDQPDPPDPDRARELLGQARSLITRDVERIRGLLDGLTSSRPAGGDLRQSLAGLADRFRTPGRRVELVVSPDAGAGRDAVELLHRITTELLRNAAGHGRAERIRIAVTPAGAGLVRLEVGDDGTGFETGRPPAPGHIGLTLVRGAVEDAGGSLSVTSAPGAGTTVTAVVPAALRLARSTPSPASGPTTG